MADQLWCGDIHTIAGGRTDCSAESCIEKHCHGCEVYSRATITATILWTPESVHVKTLYMNWHKKPRGSYHHGNLRKALIDAALDLIGSKGHRRVHIRRSGPPCRCQPSRALPALQGPRSVGGGRSRARLQGVFRLRITKAWNNGKPDPATAFRRTGEAYLEFARREPAYYSAMFESGLNVSTYPDLRMRRGRSIRYIEGLRWHRTCRHGTGRTTSTCIDGVTSYLGRQPRYRGIVWARRWCRLQATDFGRRTA